jgi:hypothetical protein
MSQWIAADGSVLMLKTTPISSETSMSTRLHNVTYHKKVILKPQNSIFKIQKIKSWCYFEMDNAGFDSKRKQENFLFFKKYTVGFRGPTSLLKWVPRGSFLECKAAR